MGNTKTIESNGVQLCVETFGSADDPAILLLAGAGSCMLSWAEEFCERLAAGGRFVIRYDARETGKSTTFEVGNPPYDVHDVVADVLGLLDALSIEKAHLVGVSGGGFVTQLLALDHADRVRSITLASTSPGGSDLPPMSEALAEMFSAEQPESDWTDRDRTVRELVDFERLFAAHSVPFDADAVAEFWGRVYDRSNNLAAQMTNPFMVGGGDSPRDRLGDITAPALVLHGTEDPLFPYEHGLALANAIPGATLLAMDRTGHENPPPRVWDSVIPAILTHTDC